MRDTRIFRTSAGALRPYYSVSYRGVRCLICSTMQDDTELVHAKFTQGSYERILEAVI